MMSVSFTIAFAFTAMGYWVVLPFTALEMAVLSYCLWLFIDSFGFITDLLYENFFKTIFFFENKDFSKYFIYKVLFIFEILKE